MEIAAPKQRDAHGFKVAGAHAVLVDVVLFAGDRREVLVPHIMRKRDDAGKADICDSRLLSETFAQLVVELHQRIAL